MALSVRVNSMPKQILGLTTPTTFLLFDYGVSELMRSSPCRRASHSVLTIHDQSYLGSVTCDPTDMSDMLGLIEESHGPFDVPASTCRAWARFPLKLALSVHAHLFHTADCPT